MSTTTIKCPKCNFEQKETDECLRCGIVISKFLDTTDTSRVEKPEAPANPKPENSSGQGKGGHVPSDLYGWNWGAFLLNFIWAIGNKTWIGLISLVPVIGLAMPVVLGLKGNEWAWQNNRWENVDYFRAVQKKWAVWGVCIALVFFVSVGGFFVCWVPTR